MAYIALGIFCRLASWEFLINSYYQVNQKKPYKISSCVGTVPVDTDVLSYVGLMWVSQVESGKKIYSHLIELSIFFNWTQSIYSKILDIDSHAKISE